LPQLQTAHSAIFAVRAQAEDPKVQRLSQQEAEVDAKHDALVRGIYGSLSMLAQVSANADELLRLRDLLFPEGAAHTQKTYRGEAGHAALVSSRLDASVQARLKAVSLQEKNLLDLVNDWLGVARQLPGRRVRATEPALGIDRGRDQQRPSRLGARDQRSWPTPSGSAWTSTPTACSFRPARCREAADSRGRKSPASPPAPAPKHPPSRRHSRRSQGRVTRAFITAQAAKCSRRVDAAKARAA
jgi:hypothetical protein